MIRKLDEQFESDTVKQIRSLIERLESIPFPEGASNYYAKELCYCLEAGALLASLHIAGALLEVTIRSLIVQRSMEAKSQRPPEEDRQDIPTLEEELEERKDLSFYELCDTLVQHGFFDAEDAERAKDLYREVRIPIHHGLPIRYTRLHTGRVGRVTRLVLRIMGQEMMMSASAFEEAVLDTSLKKIKQVVRVLHRNVV